MNRYISLLRGINVSGQKKIKMTDLKTLYEQQGCQNVITYIQSGNVVFEHPSENTHAIKEKLEAAITEKYQFSVYVDVLTVDAFENTFNKQPFTKIDIESEGNKAFIMFLSDKVDPEKISLLTPFIKHGEQLVLNENCLYTFLPDGAGKSKLTTNLIENKLDVTATARNLKTVRKLCQLAEEANE